MKKVLLGFLLALSLATSACDKPPSSRQHIATDNYKFEKPQFVHKNVNVTLVTLDTPEEIIKKGREAGAPVKRGNTLKAFTTISPQTNQCTVYVLNPEIDYEPEYVGHEFLHCVYGNWHPNQ